MVKIGGLHTYLLRNYRGSILITLYLQLVLKLDRI